MTVRFHLFPFRTQKLSSLVPKIVGWKRPVKIGRCRLLFLLWPVGQAVKTAASHAVNVGSIPRTGHQKMLPSLGWGVFFGASVRGIEQDGRPAGGKKQSCGLFFSPREMDARVTKKIPRKKLRGIFYCCFPGRQCAGGGASAER